MIKVYLGLISTGDINDLLVHTLREIERKYAGRVELIWPVDLVHRKFHDFARNGVVDSFLESDADILWFIDSDVVPPTSILDIVVEHSADWLAAGAPYPIFINQGQFGQQVVFTVYRQRGESLVPGPVPAEGTDYVEGIATGCMFLKREIFKDMQKPYFEFKYDNESRQIVEGEDLGFCFKLMKQGIQFFVDYSKVCKHYKRVDLLDMNNYALGLAQRAVNSFDAEMRQKLSLIQEKFAAKRAAKSGRTESGLILP